MQNGCVHTQVVHKTERGFSSGYDHLLRSNHFSQKLTRNDSLWLVTVKLTICTYIFIIYHIRFLMLQKKKKTSWLLLNNNSWMLCKTFNTCSTIDCYPLAYFGYLFASSMMAPKCPCKQRSLIWFKTQKSS